MGRTIDDLNPDDTPLSTPTPDIRGSVWYRFSQDIEDLLATGEYTWAEETLRAIQTTVERTHWVTDNQRTAVSNIEAGHDRQRRSRRYEGWRR